MRLLFCGDVVGRAGRDAVTTHVPALRRRLGLDFVVVEGENAAHGFGITPKICAEFFEAGVDVVTLGNHAWDQKEILSYIAGEARLLRPLNAPAATPGNGAGVFPTADGRRVLVVNVMLRLFMDALDDPFAAARRAVDASPLGSGADAALLDLHGEASSEKMAIAHFLDGRVSLAVGSHSHIPTADAQILPGGTAYQTDAGMCGDYDSVIGMRKETVVARFVTKLPQERMQPAEGEATLCGVFLETDDATGLARRVAPVRIGGRLAPAMPT